MNAKHCSTLGKYEKYLNLKGYSFNTIKVYINYAKEFLYTFDKPTLHLTINDCEKYINNYNLFMIYHFLYFADYKI